MTVARFDFSRLGLRFVALAYLVMTLGFSRLVGLMEERMNRHGR